MSHGCIFINTSAVCVCVCEYYLQVNGDWLGKLRVLPLLKEMHDPQQDPIIVRL